jgi:hypothetical protein
MIPYLLAIAGGYLIGDATKDKQLFAKGGGVENELDVIKNCLNKYGFTEHQIIRKDSWYKDKKIPYWRVKGVNKDGVLYEYINEEIGIKISAKDICNDIKRYVEDYKITYAKGGGVKGYSDKFVELGDGFEEKYFVRKFGNAGYDNKEIELLAIANIRDMESYVPSEELTDGQYHLNITLVPSEKYLSKKLKNEANDESSSVSDNTLINVVNYMGGLNYKPNDKYAFDSFEDAEEYLMSKELNDKISAEGVMSGFILDRNYNRAGDTNWDILEYMIGKKDKMFAKGGGVKDKFDYEDAKQIMYSWFDAWIKNYITDDELVNSLKRKLGSTRWFRFYKNDTGANDWQSVKSSLQTKNNREYLKEQMQYALDNKSLILYDTKGNEYGVVTNSDKIKDWYTKNYPDDDLGVEINDNNTFEDLWNGIHKHMDIYDVIGVGDSVIRERLFEHLSEIKDVNYDYIYKKWLES